MFTGLVAAVGRVVSREAFFEEGIRFTLAAPGFVERLSAGDSVAVDGVCLTVTGTEEDRFSVEAVRTTLSRTTLAAIGPGRPVNLEAAVRAGEPFGGHLVQGHVDGVARVLEVERAGEITFVRVELPRAVADLSVLHGSLALDGVSLTINRIEGTFAEVALIPYTWKHTALGRLTAGDRVNIEADMIGKFVKKLIGPYADSGERGRSVRAGREGD